MSLLGKVFYLDDVLKNRACNMLDYPEVTVETDIVFCDNNPDVTKLDVYYDKKFSDKKYPVLLNIHGGGWIVGDKRFRRGFSLQMADAGLFVIDPDYSLAPDYVFPQCIRDVAESVRWIYQNAEKYNLDLNNVFISGDSAGAHLASLITTATVSDELRDSLGLGELPVKFRATLLYCGVYDFDAKILRIPVADVMIKQLTGSKRLKDVNTSPYYKYLNPMPYMTEDFPKTMVISGALDFFTSTQHPQMLARLKELGIEHKHYHATSFFNCFHCFFLLIFMKEAKNCLKESIEFIHNSIVTE